MRRCRLFFLTLFLAGASALAGCESIDTAMNDVRQKIDDIDLSLPALTARSSTPDNERTAADGSGGETQIAAEGGTGGRVDCPPVSIVGELTSMHQFPDPDRPDASQEISEITLTGLSTACSLSGENIAVAIDLVFEGTLGPGAKLWNTDKPSFAYPYFIAVTTPDGGIVAKEVYAATVAYGKGQDTIRHTENLRQIIPTGGSYGTDHALLVGFQLTPGELAYNRMLSEKEAQAQAAPEPAPPPAPKQTAAVRPARKPVFEAAAAATVEPAAEDSAAIAPAAGEDDRPMEQEAQELESMMDDLPRHEEPLPAAQTPPQDDIAPDAVYLPDDPDGAIDITE